MRRYLRCPRDSGLSPPQAQTRFISSHMWCPVIQPCCRWRVRVDPDNPSEENQLSRALGSSMAVETWSGLERLLWQTS